jgi:hypothetical protein
VRREILWNSIEPNAPSGGVHDYHWQTADAFIANLASHNLRWYGSVGRGTTWASGAWNRPPTDQHISDYAAFAGALAARYGDNGTFWQQHPELPYLPVQDFEIWNEPDYQVFWIDSMTDAPARYGRMVAAASTAIHNADPQGRVAVGALAPTGANEFLTQMVQANPGLRGQVSTVSFHPYGHTAQRSLDRIAVLRHTIDQSLGTDVNMEITEDGIALTPTTSFTEADRADLWRKLALTLPRTDCRITAFLPLDWTGQKLDPSKPNTWYGMADWNTAQLDSSGVALKDAMLREEGLGSTPPAGGKVNVCYG